MHLSVSSFIAVKETSRIPSVFCWLLPDISEPSEEEEEFLKDKKMRSHGCYPRSALLGPGLDLHPG